MTDSGHSQSPVAAFVAARAERSNTMTTDTPTTWLREALDDLLARLADDTWWGQVAWTDDDLAALLDSPDSALEDGLSPADRRLAGHAWSARRAALGETEPGELHGLLLDGILGPVDPITGIVSTRRVSR